MKDILIIPDVHEQVDKLAKILDDFKKYPKIFLGDFFDKFGPRNTKEIAILLKTSILHDPKNTVLFGNHDLQYAFPENTALKCSGFNFSSESQILSTLKKEDWDKMKFIHWINDTWVCTHAGIHPYFLNAVTGIEYLKDPEKNNEWRNDLHAGICPAILRAGHTRGGFQRYGGITWLDWNREFEPIRGTNQIVGHTISDSVKTNILNNEFDEVESFNINLDTRLKNVILFHKSEIPTDDGTYEVLEV